MRRLLLLAILGCSGCYLNHGFGGPAPDAGPVRDTGMRLMDSGVDAGIPPGLDAGRLDAGRTDATLPFDGGGSCELPVEAYPDRDVCRPVTGDCITDCGTFQPCIIGCLQRDPTCQACAVRNALACFNSTPCVSLYPAVSCCVVEMCRLEQVDEILNVCTAFSCGMEISAYANCAIADSRERCRRAVADCGLPPNLLGFD